MSNQLIGFCKDRIQARRQILTDQMFFVCVCVYRLYGMIVSYLGSCFRLYGYALGRCIESTSNLKANNTMLLTWHTHFKVYSVYTDETVYVMLKFAGNLQLSFILMRFECFQLLFRSIKLNQISAFVFLVWPIDSVQFAISQCISIG